MAKPTKAPIAAEMAIFRHFGESACDGIFLEAELCSGVRLGNFLEERFLESVLPVIGFILTLTEYLVALLTDIPIVKPSSIPSSHSNLTSNLTSNSHQGAQTVLDAASNLDRGYNFASRDPK